MNLGLESNEVRLVDYSSKWKDEFERIKHSILKNTDLDEERIQHIGSTAIVGMSAKPIIDIAIGIDDLENISKELFKSLEKVGFLRLKVDRPNEIVLAKFLDNTYQNKTHFIHLVEYKEELWNDLIFFRDYLNDNKSARDRYLDIKKSYADKNSIGINEYTSFKESFVKEINQKRI